jgi:hypothetical protein
VFAAIRGKGLMSELVLRDISSEVEWMPPGTQSPKIRIGLYDFVSYIDIKVDALIRIIHID